MALSDVQFSKFSEMAVAMILTFLSNGRLECLLPMPDDERRDMETHLKEHFWQSLAIQVKAAHVLYRHGNVERLQKRFMVKASRLISDPHFFYSSATWIRRRWSIGRRSSSSRRMCCTARRSTAASAT